MLQWKNCNLEGKGYLKNKKHFPHLQLNHSLFQTFMIMVKQAIHCMYVKAQENKENILSQQTLTFYDRLSTF